LLEFSTSLVTATGSVQLSQFGLPKIGEIGGRNQVPRRNELIFFNICVILMLPDRLAVNAKEVGGENQHNAGKGSIRFLI